MSTTPINIMLKTDNLTLSVEGLSWDTSAEELKEQFSRLLVLAGFEPSVIDLADGGKYECTYKRPE